MKKYLITALLSIIAGWANAQHKTQFEFIETDPTALREIMQRNVGEVFSSIHDDGGKSANETKIDIYFSMHNMS